MSDSGSHVGPIIFANKFARRQLVNHGVVVTFRGDRTTGSTWWTDKYGTAKNGDCVVEQLEAIEPTQTNLAKYRELSGFPTTSDWLDAIDELHDGAETGYLYRVTARNSDQNDQFVCSSCGDPLTEQNLVQGLARCESCIRESVEDGSEGVYHTDDRTPLAYAYEGEELVAIIYNEKPLREIEASYWLDVVRTPEGESYD